MNEHIKTIKNFTVNKKVQLAASLLDGEIAAKDARINKLELVEANLQEELGNAVAKIHELEQRPEIVWCIYCKFQNACFHSVKLDDTEIASLQYCSHGVRIKSEEK